MKKKNNKQFKWRCYGNCYFFFRYCRCVSPSSLVSTATSIKTTSIAPTTVPTTFITTRSYVAPETTTIISSSSSNPTTTAITTAATALFPALQSCSSTKSVHCFNETTYQRCIVSGQTIIAVGNSRKCAAGTVCSESTGSSV